MKRGPPLAKPRKLYRFAGMGTHIRYGVHDHSLGNVRRGLVERVYMVEKNGELVDTPRPTPGAFNQLSRFHKLLRPHLKSTTRMTYKEFLGFYSGRKLERYSKAVESLEMHPVREKDAWLSTFVKAEKLNLTAKPDPAPRVIQPRDPRYNVEVGRYLRHTEEMLFRAINKVYGGRTIFKGISADEAGREFKEIWDSFSNPVGIGMDASRFDQHISRSALEFEHKMWVSMFPRREQALLRKLLSWQISNRGLARCPDGEVRYRVEGCRMSGDMNTSSGNCYIMCATVHNWCTKKGVGKFRLANNGDDCMLIIEASDEKRVRDGLIDYYKSLGFTMKVEPTVNVLERIEFCQTRPILVGDHYRMVRNCHHSLSKDLHSLQDLHKEDGMLAWVDAVGKGGRCLNDGVPVMSKFFQQFPLYNGKVKENSDVIVKLQEDWKYKFSRTEAFTGVEPSQESRYSFWLAFGILPDEQIALEKGFSPLRLNRLVEEIQEEVTLLQFSRA